MYSGTSLGGTTRGTLEGVSGSGSVSVFLEREFISKGTSGSKVQLEEVREPQDNIELPVDTHSQQTIVDTPHIAQNLRRSDRIRHEPE